METKIVQQPLMIPTEDFLKKRPLSYSSLKEFAKSPKHYCHYLTKTRETSPALLFGDVCDRLLLSPNEFSKKYAVSEKFDLRTTKGKEDSLAFELANKGKVIISQPEYDKARIITDNVNNYARAKEYLQSLKTVQRKLTWKDKKTSLPFIGYVDGDNAQSIMDVDFHIEYKTAMDATEQGFIRDAYNFNYPLQIASYRNGYAVKGKFPKTVYIVAEKTEPYCVQVFLPSEDFYTLGKQQWDKLKTSFRHCMDTNQFNKGYDYHTAYGTTILDIPGWAKRLIEE